MSATTFSAKPIYKSASLSQTLWYSTKQPDLLFALGRSDQKYQLDEVSEYKYLGHIIQSNLSLKRDIQHKKQLIEAALTTCMAVSSHEVLHLIRVDTLIQLFNTCILQIILYGTEIWAEKEIDELEQLQFKCIKRILKLPTSTPNMATIIELGCLPIRTLVHRRQLSYYHKLKSLPESLPGQILAKQEANNANEPHTWAYQIKNSLDKYNITFNSSTNKVTWKNQIKRPTRDIGESETFEKASQLCPAYSNTKTPFNENSTYHPFPTIRPDSYSRQDVEC